MDRPSGARDLPTYLHHRSTPKPQPLIHTNYMYVCKQLLSPFELLPKDSNIYGLTMKSGYTEIYASRELGEEVTSYAEHHSTPLPQHITDYHAANSDREDSMMLSSNFQSQLHLFLAGTVGAKRGKSINLDRLWDMGISMTDRSLHCSA